MKYKSRIAPWLIGAVCLGVILPLTAFHQDANPRATITPCDLRSDLRKLWEDHVTWMRLYVVSALADAPDKEATAGRLMRNQVDLGNAIEPFYGETAGAKLTALLKTHITIATQIIDAAKAGNDAKQSEGMKRWQENADEIAGFLSEANPEHWPVAHMKQMMREHLDVTAAQVAARVKKDWNADIEAYDKIHSQALAMSDMLATGITAKFPQKVR
jgi:hypothetical protein